MSASAKPLRDNVLRRCASHLKELLRYPTERLVAHHQHAVDVVLTQGGRHEPVVFGMHLR